MSYFMLLLGVLELALFLWAFSKWRQQKNNIPLLLVTIMLSVQWFDALVFGMGRWIGIGDALENLSRIRITWFWLTSPFLLIASILVLRNARFAWFQSNILLGIILVISAFYMATDGYAALTSEYYPACAADTIRYVLKVDPTQVCPGYELPDTEGYFSPMLIGSTAAIITMALTLWIWRGWPWLGVMSILFIFGFVLMPVEVAGPFLSFPLDGLMAATIVLTTLKFPPGQPGANV